LQRSACADIKDPFDVTPNERADLAPVARLLTNTVGDGSFFVVRSSDQRATFFLGQTKRNRAKPGQLRVSSSRGYDDRLGRFLRVHNLFEAARVKEVKERMALLRPNSERVWGKMNPAQALAHCAAGIELALGDRMPPRMLLGRIIGRIVKPMALGNDEPMRRNSATVKGLVVQDERDLGMERERLCGLIDRFAAAGPVGCTTHPHSFFGRLTPDEWATLMYKHLDHHLRQFGV
jgi:hypothetical protein